MLCSFLVPIRVDTKYPERNREAKVFPLGQSLSGKDEAGVKALLHGWGITCEWDSRWSAKEPLVAHYEATVVDDRRVLVKKPAMEFGFTYGTDNFVMKSKEPALMRAINSAAVDFDNDKNRAERRWSYLLFEFPEGTKLSAKAVDEDAKVGKLAIQFFAIKAADKSTAHCGWVVADLSKENQKEGKVKAPVVTKSDEQLALEEMKKLGI